MSEKSKKGGNEGYSFSVPFQVYRWPEFEDPLVAAINRMASALEAQVEAIELLARATAGEFDQQVSGDEGLPRSLGER